MWIVRDLEKTNKNLAVFYKKFNLSKGVEKALLKVSALGIFNVKINWKEIDEYFMPGWTNYQKYVHLCEYDIAKLLQQENLIEITVAGIICNEAVFTRINIAIELLSLDLSLFSFCMESIAFKPRGVEAFPKPRMFATIFIEISLLIFLSFFLLIFSE